MMLKFPKRFIGITSPFGERIINGKKVFHHGIDLGWNSKDGGQNAPLYAPADGTVIAMRNDCQTQNINSNSYGNYVKIDHGGGICTLQAHMKYQSVLVRVGDRVSQGQQIGTIGTTGASLGVHDHYEVWVNGVRKDPLFYTYVFPDQEVGSDTKRDYAGKIMYYVPITPPVPRDTNKDQVETLATLNVRSGAGTNQTILGTVTAGNIYNYYEVKEGSGYTWYRIADGQWLATDGTYLNVYPKEDEKMIEELKKEIEALKIRIAELEKDIIVKDELILEQKAKISELESRTWVSMFIDWLKNIFKKEK